MTDEYHAEQTLKQLAAMLGVDGNLYRDLPLAVRALQVSERDAMANVRHWKANHDNMVSRCALLSQREDLPVDRIPAYEELVKYQTKADNNEGMAECMRMFRDDMIRAGIITDAVPAMFMSEAILNAIGESAEDTERLNYMQKRLLRKASMRFGLKFKEVNAWAISSEGEDLRAAVDMLMKAEP